MPWKLLMLVGLLMGSAAAEAATHVVDNQAPNASDENPGTPEAPFKTINAAAQVAKPGDTVQVHAGTYREHVMPARGGADDARIVYEAAPGETVVVKGSEEWNAPWTAVEGRPGVFRSPIDLKRFEGTRNPYGTTISIAARDNSTAARPIAEGSLEKPWPMTLGQVFIDEKPAVQAASPAELESSPNAWIVSADGRELLLHLPDQGKTPADVRIEWSVRSRIFAPYRRGLSFITVRGFHFRHCANQGPFPQAGAVSSRTGRYWIFENNDIRHAKTIGLDIGSETWNVQELRDTADEDKKLLVQSAHIVRNNMISDNGLCGIAGWNARGAVIYNNVVERNNRLDFAKAKLGWEEWAGIKLHATDAIIAGNLIRDNEASGIWIDNDYHGARITGNVVLNNTHSGIFLELGAGSVLIDNNVVAQTRSGGGFYPGNGIYSHDASGLRVVHNLLLGNEGYGVCMRNITDRKIWNRTSEASDNEIFNNVFADNGKPEISLPFPNVRCRNNGSDDNLFLKRDGGEPTFEFNKFYGAFKWEDAYAHRVSAANALGIDPATLAPFDAWRKNPVMSLALWAQMTEWDRHSAVAALDGWRIQPDAQTMSLSMPAAAWKLGCRPVAEVGEDFAGVPFDSKHPPIPGPFQNLKEGVNTVELQPRTWEAPPALRSIPKRLPLPRHALKSDGEAQRRLMAAFPGQGRNGLPEGLPAKGDSPWFTGLQEGKDPGLAAPFVQVTRSRSTELFAKSPAGVCSSPAPVLLWRADQAGAHRVAIAASLKKRRFASAGIARATVFTLAPDGSKGEVLKTFDLNTPDGYRGKTLPERFEWQHELTLETGAYVAVRFQIVAPGPAPAGDGALVLERFEVDNPVK